MGMGRNLRQEITEWGVLTIVIVVLSVILVKYQINDSVVCPSAATPYWNATASLCGNATNDLTQNSSASGLYSTLSTFVTALSEPKNWVAIVIIGLIGFGLVKLFTKRDD